MHRCHAYARRLGNRPQTHAVVEAFFIWFSKSGNSDKISRALLCDSPVIFPTLEKSRRRVELLNNLEDFPNGLEVAARFEGAEFSPPLVVPPGLFYVSQCVPHRR